MLRSNDKNRRAAGTYQNTGDSLMINTGVKCPNCGSDDIEATGSENQLFGEVICLCCRYRFEVRRSELSDWFRQHMDELGWAWNPRLIHKGEE